LRWWGGWAEGEHRDTLIKYLLDELNTYEDDYNGMLLPVQPDTDGSFLGEPVNHRSTPLVIQSLRNCPTFPSLTRPIIPINVSAPGIGSPQPHASNYPSTPMSGAVAKGRLLPTKGLIVPDVPVTRPDGTKSRRQDSWSIIVQHWESGDPAHGLLTPLKDWPKEWLTGPNKPLAMKHNNRKMVALEFINQYHRNREDFLKAYPEAEVGGSKLLTAINEARKKRGDLITRK
ncbi:hypothetical protein B0H14DRAFT_2399022, partial [Mycena olivaceomarginata]